MRAACKQVMQPSNTTPVSVPTQMTRVAGGLPCIKAGGVSSKIFLEMRRTRQLSDKGKPRFSENLLTPRLLSRRASEAHQASSGHITVQVWQDLGSEGSQFESSWIAQAFYQRKDCNDQRYCLERVPLSVRKLSIGIGSES